MSPPLEVGVAAVALWNPSPAARPQPSILPPNERRRAPDSVAIALQVAHAACLQAGRDPARLPMVFASTYGDLAITDYMCSTLASAPTTLSPTRFHNSVHNAAAGYWTIATGCREPYCALGAGVYSFAAGLLAAAVQVCADQTDVLLVAYDTEVRGAPQSELAESHGMLGIALLLSTSPRAGEAGLQLAVAPRAETDTATAIGAASTNAMAAGLPLVAALRGGAVEMLPLPLGPDSTLQVRIQRGGEKISLSSLPEAASRR
ncbi:MAG TPA: beta-ketoacyl synthase chain length factor [Steroidobacteraceae bacterium]|nr:beta-ketoacyl synthase chain length factor [Steroidobacteraceae bacterium]